MRGVLAIAVVLAIAGPLFGDLPATLPAVEWRLTPKPWKASGLERGDFLLPLERAARAMAALQNDDGAIVDPYLRREFQYSTPYFACAIAQLNHAGVAKDLLPSGVRAMEHATRCFEGGLREITDRHGEFFIPSLAEALELYRGSVDEDQWNRWKERLRTPTEEVLAGEKKNTNNWRTYAMRGEWLRVNLGLIDRDDAIRFIERSWKDNQRERMTKSRWNLYLDHTSMPNSQAVESVGRGNLIGLLAAGYDGPSASEMRELTDRATRVSLLMQDPTGQCPTNGRTDNHVWNDILYQTCFETAAERAHKAGDSRLAGQYRRAASLAFTSALRWQREDGAFSVTKNFFANEQRVGYQPASQWTNYNGAVMIHLGESYALRRSAIAETPAPAEIGSYAFENDPEFASAFANAGGMQLMINLEGEVDPARYNMYWTPLGIARISRAGWDSRLGPLDGARDTFTKRGVTLGPTWSEDRDGAKWTRLVDVPEKYRGEFRAELATPALTICSVRYAPVAGEEGPTFDLHFTITPDGVLARMKSKGIDADKTGWTLPLLEDDGRNRTHVQIAERVASSFYSPDGDEQAYLITDGAIEADEDSVLGSAGWLRPVRARTNAVFIYPRKAGEPTADSMQKRLRISSDGFATPLVRVHNRVAIGADYAGGEARTLDLNSDGKPDLEFDQPTRFLARLKNGRVTDLETDRPVSATIHGQPVRLTANQPWQVP